MKLNWINIVAALLIVGGVFLLVKRTTKTNATATTHPVTDDEMKRAVYGQIGNRLGRPLDDIEKQMVTVVRNGDHATVTIVEPLHSRLVEAQKKARLRDQSGTMGTGSTGTPVPPAISPSLPSSMNDNLPGSPPVPATSPTAP